VIVDVSSGWSAGKARAAVRRIMRWLGDPEGFAAVDAVNGEPGPLFALEACRRAQLATPQRLDDHAKPPRVSQRH
jgi:hypothetical protein